MAKKNSLPWPLNEWGKSVDDALVAIVGSQKQFFRNVIRRARIKSGRRKVTKTIDGKRYKIDLVNYPKSKPSQIALRLSLLLNVEPGDTVAAVFEELNPFK